MVQGTGFRIGAHNPEVVGSNPAPATAKAWSFRELQAFFCGLTKPAARHQRAADKCPTADVPLFGLARPTSCHFFYRDVVARLDKAVRGQCRRLDKAVRGQCRQGPANGRDAR